MNTDTHKSARTRLIAALADRIGHERRQNRVHRVLPSDSADQPVAGTVFEIVAHELRKMGVDPGETVAGIGQILGVDNVVRIGRGRFKESVLGSEVADNLRALINEPAAQAA